MKFKVQCVSYLRRQEDCVYSFEPKLYFGLASEGLYGNFSIHSKARDLFTVSEHYEVEIKQASG